MHKRGHAVAVVGYQWRVPVTTAVPGLRYAWDEVESLSVVDDNYLPYFSIRAKPVPTLHIHDFQALDSSVVYNLRYRLRWPKPLPSAGFLPDGR